MKFRSTACVFGDNVNTDEIIAARYLNTSDPAVLAEHCMEDVRPGFARSIVAGQLIVAGDNFGCGSSREHAPIALKAAGICCVVAGSFARIFFRNAISTGLPIVECPGISGQVAEGDTVEVDLDKGLLTLSSGEQLPIPPFPLFMQKIIQEGGWIPFLTAHQETPGGAL